MQPPPESGAIRQLADVASLALEEARRQGASQCEADASRAQGLSVSVRLREVDTLEYQRDRALALPVTPPRIRMPDWWSPGRWPARSPISISITPGTSPRSARSSWRANVRPRAPPVRHTD